MIDILFFKPGGIEPYVIENHCMGMQLKLSAGHGLEDFGAMQILLRILSFS
jgi:hypothetical protein